MTIRVLAVSDQVDPRIHSATLRQRMPDIDLVFGAGDLPSRYLEFLADALERPVYYVLGNHMEEWVKDAQSGKLYEPMGAVGLNGKVVYDRSTGLIIAGLSGSPKYSGEGGQQFSELQVYRTIARMVPKLLYNRLRRGRWVDVLITHAPPRNVNDRLDVAHRGFAAYRTFVSLFKPRYLIHGHIHLYDRNESWQAILGETRVLNVFPYQKLELDFEKPAVP
jgi:Icc-related predicted phosphoesterase